MNKEVADVCKLYIFESLERITRFYVHLEEINDQFYLDDDIRVKDKLSFINSYEECLEKMVRMLIDYAATIENEYSTIDAPTLTKIFDRIVHISSLTNILHSKWLVHLPRPSEPIELRRFCRVIEKQVLILNPQSQDTKKTQISIYVNEAVGESTYVSDPLQHFKASEINPAIHSYKEFFSAKSVTVDVNEFSIEQDINENSTIHITIPRIDANNPCHWPTLMHEVAHTIMANDFFESSDIETDFLNSLNENQKKDVDRLKDLVNLKSWLTESWCDLFASVSMGHSFWFSQYASFLASSLNSMTNEYHPPALFRLNLIEKVLTHRFSNEVFEVASHLITPCESILKRLDVNNKLPYTKDPRVRKLFLYFREYFLQHFFKLKGDKIEIGKAILNEKLQEIVKYVNNIQIDPIKDLVTSLKSGLPIPSICNKASVNYSENPTTIQEIFLAAWLYRNSPFKDKILANLLDLKAESEEPFKERFKLKIEKEFRRFDQSILRSIQVSEWVDILKDDPADVVTAPLTKINPLPNPAYKSIITDREIEQLILNKQVRIIPIINFRKQLGSTSFDIRLGTSFQLYFPNQYGVIDFIDAETIKNASKNSKKINLDFLESITITPGQFMLGHSMEYIKLADDISADLEGRSSFARLGLEIHMTAGFVDPGFEGVLTFEIFNAGPNPVRLYPGMRIGQLRFIPINIPEKSYANRHAAKYKGLLEHHNSLQGKDYEVDILRREITNRKK